MLRHRRSRGFFIGELDGRPAATVSCVNYDEKFAFLGFYIVRPDLRGSGYGLHIWNAAIAHAGSRVIGLDGVVAQQENYRKSGFQLAYANVRYGGTVAAPPAPPGIVALGDVPFAMLEASDATVFPAARSAFLRAWISAPGHVGCALMRDGALAGWGVIRPCRRAARSARWSPMTAPLPRRFCPPCWRAPAAARFFSTFPPSIATPSHWPKVSGLRRCSRPRACIPAKFRPCGWIACSESPHLNWDDLATRHAMSDPSRQAHWQGVYTSKGEKEVSWYQDNPAPSLDLIALTGASRGTRDRGCRWRRVAAGRSSARPDFERLTVLDLSAAALDAAKARLGEKAKRVRWEVADITRWNPPASYDVWHDRAAFHFLTDPADQAAYAERARRAVKAGGHVIIGTFALDGPERCSGLPIVRHDAASLSAILGQEFKLIDERRHDHVTPWGAVQHFQFSTFRRDGGTY